jgi:hypothetical protein
MQTSNKNSIQNIDNQEFRPGDESKDEKLKTITEFLKAGDNDQAKVYFTIADAKDTTLINSSGISSQRKSEYQCILTNEWDGYMKDLNKDFFDNNKLYIKSMQDYKTTHNIKPNRTLQSPLGGSNTS